MSATAIAAAFEPNGKLTSACTSLTTAVTTANSLSQSVSQAGGDISVNNPEWGPMMTALQAAKVQTCTTLVADLKATAGEAVTACQHG